jgi:hypothetical protein
LEGEHETGKAAARLDGAASAIRARLAKGGAVRTADPGATAVSLIMGTSADNVAAWSALFGSLALELAGMIAMMRAESRHELASVRSTGNAGQSASQAASSTALSIEPGVRRTRAIAGVTLIDPPKSAAIEGVDTVGRFMLACLGKAPGEETAGGAIYARYQRWREEQQPPVGALDLSAFAQQFAERCERVGIRTRRDGRKVYCLGVQLVA